MRVFPSSPLSPEKSLLMPPTKKMLPPMQDQAFPVGHRLLKLGLGIGGVLSAICPSALANPPKSVPEPETKRTLSASVEPELDATTPPPLPDETPLTKPAKTHLKAERKPALEVNSNEVAQPEAVQPAPLPDLLLEADVLEEARSRDRGLPQQPDQPLDQLCHSLQRCEQSITLDIDATGATVSDVFEVAPNVRGQDVQLQAVPAQDVQMKDIPAKDVPAKALPELSGHLAQVQKDEALEERDEDEQSDDPREDEVDSSTEEPKDKVDDELGIIRANPLRSDVDLGILRLLQTATAKPKAPEPPFAFLIARLGFLDSDNTFRSSGRRSNGEPFNGVFVDGILSNGVLLNRRDNAQVYQSGLSLYLFPRLSKNTNLYLTAETNLARYEGDNLTTIDDGFNVVRITPDYNELEFQLGIRHKFRPRTHAQIGVRNQTLYRPGYEDKFFSANYIDALVSHRSIFNSRTWLDSVYQIRYGFASPKRSSRVRQTLMLSLNYGFSKDLRTTLLYQTDLDDYTQTSRFDIYQQILGVISYKVTPEARLSLFGGTRFGHSSESNINLDDTFYGAGLNVNLPLF